MMRIVITSLLLGLGVAGCSSDEGLGTGGAGGTGGSGATGGTGTTGGAGGSTGGAGGAAGTGGGTGSDIVVGPCTEAGSVCATFKFPTATDATRIIVGFYAMPLPPPGPPDKLGVQYDTPKYAAAAEVQMKILDVSLDGEYFLYSALYMPGGGQFQPKKGIDYEAFTSAKVTLSKGVPLTIPGTLEFALAK
jgi:hypothetical protein